MSEAQVWLTSGQAADLVGVHTSSIKRWCDTEELRCSYTEGGHRRIALMELLHLAQLKELACELKALGQQARSAFRAIEEAREVDKYVNLIAMVYRWLKKTVRGMIGPLLQFMVNQGMSVAAVADKLIAPLLYRIGKRWKAGNLEVGDEHRMFHLLLDELNRLRVFSAPRGQRQKQKPLALVGCGEGNQHEMGARLVRWFLEASGVATVYLGARLPPEEMALQQVKLGASLVCISVAHPNVSSDVYRMLRVMEQFYNPNRPYALLLGGQALQDLTQLNRSNYSFYVKILYSIQALEGWLPNHQKVINGQFG